MSHLFIDPDQRIYLSHGFNMEALVGQLQPTSTKILAVKNGYELLVLNDSRTIPITLSEERKPIWNEKTKIYEYHFRDKVTDDLYVFFHPDLYDWLKSSRRKIFSLISEEILSSSSDEKLENNNIVEDDEIKNVVFQIPTSSSVKPKKMLFIPTNS